MTSPRRVGATTSKTRDTLLDCVERLMLEKGYPAVTYRAVAAKANVTPGLVQYYFPTLDDVFVAAVRRRSEQNVERLRRALEKDAEQPLHVVWHHSKDESTAALTAEFLAVGNHRKSIRSAIAKATEAVRRLQLEVLQTHAITDGGSFRDLPSDVLLFLLTGVPKLIRLEKGIGVSTTHDNVVAAFEQLLDSIEPRRPRSTATRRRPGAPGISR